MVPLLLKRSLRYADQAGKVQYFALEIPRPSREAINRYPVKVANRLSVRTHYSYEKPFEDIHRGLVTSVTAKLLQPPVE